MDLPFHTTDYWTDELSLVMIELYERRAVNCEALEYFLTVDDSIQRTHQKEDVHSPIQWVNYEETLDETLCNDYDTHWA